MYCKKKVLLHSFPEQLKNLFPIIYLLFSTVVGGHGDNIVEPNYVYVIFAHVVHLLLKVLGGGGCMLPFC